MRSRTNVISAPRALGAVRLRWVVGDAVSADGHLLSVWFAASMAAGDGDADRALFAESFGDVMTTTAEQVIARFQPVVADAVRKLAATMSAEDAVAASDRWIEAIRPPMTTAAFGAGLEVLAPFEAGASSPSAEMARQEQLRRQAADRRAGERVEQFARATELLRHWDSLRADVPGVTPGAVLRQVDAADRGQMLQSLLMASAAEPADLWVAAGSTLVKFAKSDPAAAPKLLPMPTAVGPLRSLRIIDDRVWIGGRSGVLSVDRRSPDEVTSYDVPGLKAEHGFSAVVTAADRVWAVHREAGLVSWPISGPDRPTVSSPKQLGGPPTALAAAGGVVLFAVGRHVFRVDDGGPVMEFEAGSDVVALLAVDRKWAVVGSDGAIDLLGGPNLDRVGGTSTGSSVDAAGVLPWLSSGRILLCHTDAPVECVGLDDGVVTRYGGGPIGLKGVAGSSARVAALTGDRRRIVLWNAWDGQCPVGEVPIFALSRHRAVDVAMG